MFPQSNQVLKSMGLVIWMMLYCLVSVSGYGKPLAVKGRDKSKRNTLVLDLDETLGDFLHIQQEMWRTRPFLCEFIREAVNRKWELITWTATEMGNGDDGGGLAKVNFLQKVIRRDCVSPRRLSTFKFDSSFYQEHCVLVGLEEYITKDLKNLVKGARTMDTMFLVDDKDHHIPAGNVYIIPEYNGKTCQSNDIELKTLSKMLKHLEDKDISATTLIDAKRAAQMEMLIPRDSDKEKTLILDVDAFIAWGRIRGSDQRGWKVRNGICKFIEKAKETRWELMTWIESEMPVGIDRVENLERIISECRGQAGFKFEFSFYSQTYIEDLNRVGRDGRSLDSILVVTHREDPRLVVPEGNAYGIPYYSHNQCDCDLDKVAKVLPYLMTVGINEGSVLEAKTKSGEGEAGCQCFVQ